MENLIQLVTPKPKYYFVRLKDGRTVRVKANSYDATTYATYGFYLESADVVSKADLKGMPCTPIFEISRKSVESISEEGVIDISEKVTEIKEEKKPRVRKRKAEAVVKKSRKKN